MGAVGEVYLDDGENDCPSLEDARGNLSLIVRAVNCHAELLAALKYAGDHVARYAWTQGNSESFHKEIMAPIAAAIAHAEGEIS